MLHIVLFFQSLVKYVSRIPLDSYYSSFPHNFCINKFLWTDSILILMLIYLAILSSPGEQKYSVVIKMIICVVAQFFQAWLQAMLNSGLGEVSAGNHKP